jgi:hypothetical protein
MKTKNIPLLAIAFLVMASLASCHKILDRKPQDAITDLNYWQTTDELKLYCNAFYTGLSVPSTTSDNQSDNVVPSTPNPWLYNQAVVPSTGGGWATGDWSTIRNANYFLSHYQTVAGDQNEINQYLSEILFFRAYNYFAKIQTFGDVPWINKNLNTNDSSYLYMPRTPRQTVVDSIIADLTFAANHMYAKSSEAGRLHKYAAWQLLARVALYQGTYMKYRNISGWEAYLNTAVSAAQEIMNSGLYNIVKPTAQYYYKTGDLINAATNTYAAQDYPLPYKEQFIQESLTGNAEAVLPRIYIVNILAQNLSRTVNESSLGASKDLIEDFLCADGLPIRLSPLYKGDDSVIAEMQNRDPRLRNMINNRFLPSYLNGTQIVSDYLTPVRTSTTPTGYLVFKFRSPIPAQSEANQSTFDLYIFRYAEVLLIYAEAKAELGTITQNDLDISINKLRARLDEPSFPGGIMARLTLNPPADPAATTITGEPRYGYAVSPLIYEIRRERRIELAFEGFRWNDIVRWKAGALINNPKTVYGMTASAAVQSQYNSFFGSNMFASVNIISITDWDKVKPIVSPYTLAMRKWIDKLYLSPLPKDQITLSKGALVQNPGWDTP